jgi:hypothetical protein
MNVAISISYQSKSGNNIMQRGSFPVKGRKHEVVALEFWKWIKREMSYECTIELVIADGKDITDKVKNLEAPLE